MAHIMSKDGHIAMGISGHLKLEDTTAICKVCQYDFEITVEGTSPSCSCRGQTIAGTVTRVEVGALGVLWQTHLASCVGGFADEIVRLEQYNGDTEMRLAIYVEGSPGAYWQSTMPIDDFDCFSSNVFLYEAGSCTGGAGTVIAR